MNSDVTLWSVQSGSAYREFLRTGVLRASDEHIDPSFTQAYNWMSTQFDKKVPRPVGDMPRYPVWAWLQYDGVEHAKPPRGDGILVEITVDPHLVLASDCQKWHAVLNGEYLPEDCDDQRAFDRWVASLDLAESSCAAAVRSKIEASWDRIFDVNAPGSDCWEEPHERQIQAVLWHVSRDKVVSVSHSKSDRH